MLERIRGAADHVSAESLRADDGGPFDTVSAARLRCLDELRCDDVDAGVTQAVDDEFGHADALFIGDALQRLVLFG